MVKKLKWNLVLMSVLYLGLGIFLVMKPGTASDAMHGAAWCWPARPCS